MLNQAEFLQLKNHNLSHMARTLYVFYLKPEVIKGHNQIDLVDLTSKLTSLSPNFPLRPSSEQIGAALDELESLKLVTYLRAGEITPYAKREPLNENLEDMAKVQAAVQSFKNQSQGSSQGSPYQQYPQGAYPQSYGANFNQGPEPEAMYPQAPNGQASCAYIPNGNGQANLNPQGQGAPMGYQPQGGQVQCGPYGQQGQQGQYSQGANPWGQFPTSTPYQGGQGANGNAPCGYSGGNGYGQGHQGNATQVNAPVNFTRKFTVEYEDTEKKDPWRWQGAFIALPLFSQPAVENTGKPFRMFSDWLPGPTLAQAAHRAGLLDYSFDNRILQEFVSYWQTRGDERTQFAWERAFIQRLIKLNQIADIKERGLHKPDYKKGRRHEFQTLSSIFTGVREYKYQPGLEKLTTNLMGDSTHSDLKTQYASAENLGAGQSGPHGMVADRSLLPSMAKAAGLELEDDDIMIIPGYTQPNRPSPFANGGYITPPRNPLDKNAGCRLSPKELLDQLSAYSAQEVEDVLYKLSKNRKFASVFETGGTSQEGSAALQGDPSKTIPLTSPSMLNPEYIHPLSTQGQHQSTETTAQESQDTNLQGSMSQGQALPQELGEHKHRDHRGKRKSGDSYVPVDMDKLKPYL